jgi:hypothetical protein
MDKLKALLTSEHFEVSMRLGITMFLGYVFTFANIPMITPVGTPILMGVLVPFCAMLFPTLSFTFGTLIFPLFSLLVFSYVSCTALMAIAVAGGTGVFVVAFAIWSLWICFTRWDKTEGNKTSLLLIIIVFQTVLIWPNYDTVQNGFTVPSQDLTPDVQGPLMTFTAGAVEAAKLLGVGTHDIEINDGTLAGRVAYVTIDEDGSNSTFIEGGMWIIRGQWNFRGFDNPLATYPNFFLWIIWVIIILGVAVLLPPLRTMRSAVWRGILPAALRDAAASIRLHAARMKEAKSSVELGNNKDTGQNDNVSEEKRLATRGRCIYHLNALFDGTLAKYSVFEPRLLAFKPPQWTVAILVQLSAVTSRCIRIAVGIELLVDLNDGKEFLHHNTDLYLEAAATLENCAAALQTGNVSLLDAIDAQDSTEITPLVISEEGQEKDETKAESTEIKEDEADLAKDISNHEGERSPEEEVKEEPQVFEGSGTATISRYDPFQIKQRTSEVVALSRAWLKAMDSFDHEQKGYFDPESIDAFKKNIRPWFMVYISHWIYLYAVLKAFFQKATWQSLMKPETFALTRLVWCVKYTLGMTVLLAMSIYWEDYKENFVLALPEDSELRSAFAFQNGGWALVAYCFATTQTAEGSIKKGILRMLGTITGAFSAWLALIICEDAGFDYDYNTYGLVAWLTISSFLATYVATERGFAARISLSNDFAYGPIYFVITQVIIVTYAYFAYGPESKGALTANRLVANLLGIVVAMVLAVIPPGNWGGDPGHSRSINRLHWNATQEFLRLLLSCQLNDDGEPSNEDCQQASEKLMQLSVKTLHQSTKMQVMAVDFEKDASKLQRLPYFKVDPRLKLEIGKVTRDINITIFLPQLAARLVLEPDRRFLMLGRDSVGRKELESLFSKMQDGLDGSKKTSGLVKGAGYHETVATTTDAEVDLELLLRTVDWLINEIECHEEALDRIKYGF